MPNQTRRIHKDASHLKALALRACKDLDGASAVEVLRWTVDTFKSSFIVAANMQHAALIDLATKIKSDIDVVFIDTGYHFAETIATRDAVGTIYPHIRIINATPNRTTVQQGDDHGPRLYKRDPDLCCHLRKVIPLRNTLRAYSAWVTGLRRADSPTRGKAPVVAWDDQNLAVKVNPIVDWTDDELIEYIDNNNVLANPLTSEGYLSIGCAPCTAKVLPGAATRSGRWSGKSKTECGLHR